MYWIFIKCSSFHYKLVSYQTIFVNANIFLFVHVYVLIKGANACLYAFQFYEVSYLVCCCPYTDYFHLFLRAWQNAETSILITCVLYHKIFSNCQLEKYELFSVLLVIKEWYA